MPLLLLAGLALYVATRPKTYPVQVNLVPNSPGYLPPAYVVDNPPPWKPDWSQGTLISEQTVSSP